MKGLPIEAARRWDSRAETRLLIERVRVGLWIIFAANVTFALGDLYFNWDRIAPLFALKLVQLATVLLAFQILRRGETRASAVAAALLIVSVSALMTATSGILTAEVVPTAILCVTGSVIVGSLLPWGIAPQVATAAITGSAVLANVYFVSGNLASVVGYPGFAVIFGLLGSIVVAYEFERHRTALGREQLARREAERVRVEQDERFRHGQEALRAAQEWIESAVESSDIGLWDWDLRTNATFYSPFWKRQLGYEADEFRGSWEEWWSSLHPEDRERVALNVQEHFQHPHSKYEVELRLRHKDGSYRWMLSRARVLRDAAGQPYRMLGSHLDITARRQAEERLRESQHFLQSTLDALSAHIAILDEGGTIIAVNEAWRRFAEANAFAGAACGLGFNYLSVCDATTPDCAEEATTVARGIRAVMSGQQREFYREYTCHSPNEERWFVARVTRFNSTGPVRVVVAHEDITPRKRVEKELAVARDQAIEATRLKSDFVATMSHEIRTPMNGVIGMTGLLLDTPLTAQQREYAEIVRDSGGALLALVNDILDFSKIEAGKLELELFDFNLRQMVETVIDLFAEPAQRKQLRLSSRIEAGVPRVVRGDPGRLRQVLTNLIDNAIKFTERGGVTLHITRAPGTAADVTIRFEVRDTGIGLTSEARSHLFQAFSQADASTTRKYGGTGLGLVICKQLVTMMDGEIGVDSEPGRGSTFWFSARLRTPVAAVQILRPVSELSGAAGRVVAAPVSPRGRILVAEDNAVNQKVAVRMLEKLGYRADVAGNGSEVLEAVARIPYTAVLMDCRMPEMDGFDACRCLREREAGGHRLPVVAMTANALQGDRERCLAAGMDDYIAKPITEDALARVLERWARGPVCAVTADTGVGDTDERPTLLQRFGGDTRLLQEVSAVFLQDCPQVLQRMRDALAGNDRRALELAAHTLKGALGHFGAESAVAAARRLETLARDGDLPQAAGAYAALQDEIDRLTPMLNSACQVTV